MSIHSSYKTQLTQKARLVSFLFFLNNCYILPNVNVLGILVLLQCSLRHLPALVRLAEITEEHDFVQSYITIGTQVRKS